MAAFGGNESCPNCGARMAADQRYCLNCGHRRGEPRLPFMDAVVFMESMGSPGAGASTPPPPPPGEQKAAPRMNANAALIAGVATLVLAIGVGFLIGRSGHENSQQAAAPQVIKVEGGSGAGEETAKAATPEETTGGAKASGKSGGESKSSGSKSSPKTKKKTEEQSETGANGTTKAAEAVLKPKVPQAPPKVQVGDSCEQGTAGCSSSGEFDGNFFGE
jgi:hypothetical protein